MFMATAITTHCNESFGHGLWTTHDVLVKRYYTDRNIDPFSFFASLTPAYKQAFFYLHVEPATELFGDDWKAFAAVAQTTFEGMANSSRVA